MNYVYQFEARHANARNLHVVLVYFILDPCSFMDYAGLRFESLTNYVLKKAIAICCVASPR